MVSSTMREATVLVTVVLGALSRTLISYQCPGLYSRAHFRSRANPPRDPQPESLEASLAIGR